MKTPRTFIVSQDFLLLLAALSALFIASDSASAQVWTPTSAPSANWYAVASSADGSNLVAVVYGGSIYTSTNSGTIWSATSAPNTNWASVASSADGTKMATSATP